MALLEVVHWYNSAGTHYGTRKLKLDSQCTRQYNIQIGTDTILSNFSLYSMRSMYTNVKFEPI